MKYIKLYIPFLAFALMLGSCEKYLDIERRSLDKFIETADDCQRILDNYTIMNTNYPSDGQASTDDYYLGTNTYPGSISQENKDFYTWQISAIHQNADPQWLKPYSTIYAANLVLEALDKGLSDKADASALNNIKGSALFFRAYALWNVAQLYTKPYGTSSGTDPGIPARTSPDLSDVSTRGTVQETYTRIVKDLQDAINLLPTITTTVSSRPDKAAAYAMLARVYLSMEDYPQALINANASLQIKSTLIDYNKGISTTSTTPFPRFNDEVLFQSTIAAIATGGSTSASNADHLLHPGTASSPRARINETLYNMYDANDLRKVIFFKPNTGLYTGTYRFTGSYEPTTGPTLFNGLTTSEMYLTRAECYARTGKVNEAMVDLNALLRKRWLSSVTYPVITAANPDDALTKILAERRKELVMRGMRWTDLRRLNKDARFKVDQRRTVTEGTPAVTTTYTLLANDPRYTMLIPLQVINSSTLQQNQR